MFSPDILNLRQFYSTPLGESCRGLIARAVSSFWPELRGDLLLGLGYAAPYVEIHASRGGAVTLCMPAQMGAACWPSNGANRAFMAHESELPLSENSVNRILLVHAVENSEQLSWMMQELWRVLTPGGRVLAVVPNRMGIWSRSPRSPFGYGRPFSMAQLRDLFSANNFTTVRSASALFTPPTYFHFVWRAAARVESVGRMLCPFFGGVLLIEAEKQLYAAIKEPVAARKSYRAAAAKPAMSS